MNTAEITRTIDNLGRITIPISFRKRLNINVGDELNISLVDDSIVYKKASVFDTATRIIEKSCEEFTKITGKKCLVTSADRVISASDEHHDFVEKNKDIVDKVIATKKTFSGFNADNLQCITCTPIIKADKAVGTIAVFQGQSEDLDVLKWIDYTAKIIAAQIIET